MIHVQSRNISRNTVEWGEREASGVRRCTLRAMRASRERMGNYGEPGGLAGDACASLQGIGSTSMDLEVSSKGSLHRLVPRPRLTPPTFKGDCFLNRRPPCPWETPPAPITPGQIRRRQASVSSREIGRAGRRTFSIFDTSGRCTYRFLCSYLKLSGLEWATLYIDIGRVLVLWG